MVALMPRYTQPGCYAVLTPTYTKTGERTADNRPYWAVEWDAIGFVDSVEEAKRTYGGAPVLQWCPPFTVEVSDPPKEEA